MGTLRTIIGHWEGSKIAAAVAKKAFHHLKEPYNQRMLALGKNALDTFISHGLGTTQAKLVGVGMGFESKTCTDWYYIEVRSTSGQTVSIPYAIHGDTCFVLHAVTSNFYLVSEQIYQQFTTLVEDDGYRAILESMDQLEREMYDQCVCKTVRAVVKAWPEVTDIVYDVLRIQEPRGMTTPLEVLLSKYLPALPAPKS